MAGEIMCLCKVGRENVVDMRGCCDNLWYVIRACGTCGVLCA